MIGPSPVPVGELSTRVLAWARDTDHRTCCIIYVVRGNK